MRVHLLFNTSFGYARVWYVFLQDGGLLGSEKSFLKSVIDPLARSIQASNTRFFWRVMSGTRPGSQSERKLVWF